MSNPQRVDLNIAGERFPVDYDGVVVSSPEFPGVAMEYLAPCGVRVDQRTLVFICRSKLATALEASRD